MKKKFSTIRRDEKRCFSFLEINNWLCLRWILNKRKIIDRVVFFFFFLQICLYLVKQEDRKGRGRKKKREIEIDNRFTSVLPSIEIVAALCKRE